MNVVEAVVEKGFCSGCGLCAGVCPQKILETSFDQDGNLVPGLAGFCADCGLCVSVCPFSGIGDSLDKATRDTFGEIPGVSRGEVSGFTLSFWEGCAATGGYRQRGASGGMASWFLARVLEDGLAESVVAVGPAEAPERFWSFREVVRPEDVSLLAGSVYHPVSVENAVQQILDGPNRRYAVMALPCLAYGLRKAMKLVPELGERIVLVASLACGMLPNRGYTKYVSLESGILPADTLRVDFRYPPENTESGNFRHVAIALTGNQGRPVPLRGMPDFLWKHLAFQQGGCLICDDVFGEAADVVFMDAWLPEYEHDPRGNSVVVCRTPETDAMLRKATEDGECALKETTRDRLMNSQTETLMLKRTLLAGRLAEMQAEGVAFPERRVGPSTDILERNRPYFETCRAARSTAQISGLECFEDLKVFRKIMKELAEKEKESGRS
ncbi:MAG: Coenzyme F420 hydrogenase/dehydrogenase, beta subunit C-terminal domain [Synergistota bacterium]|nr:Coenzyme F420 hydrogenase/dehydrogenase, beta subunit C-terminal domain [Synergistota bacterium]